MLKSLVIINLLIVVALASLDYHQLCPWHVRNKNKSKSNINPINESHISVETGEKTLQGKLKPDYFNLRFLRKVIRLSQEILVNPSPESYDPDVPMFVFLMKVFLSN
jgi:hypothetical protein